MNLIRIVGLAAVGIAVWTGPALASVEPAPGPIAGVGLPALALVGGAYWLGRKLFGRKKYDSSHQCRGATREFNERSDRSTNGIFK